MHPNVLAKIGVRLVAIYLLAQALVYFPSVVLLGHGESGGVEVLSVGLASIPIIVAALLWTLAPRFADWMSGTDPDTGVPASLREIQTAAIATVGLILLFDALPTLVITFNHAIIQAPEMDGVSYYQRDMVGNLIGSGLRVALAIALILGAKFWTTVLWRIRNFGSNG